ncbi:EAL domain-containing protein [Nitratireductor mangrovi]|uniref:EAL domain-containing protein n=1 Tax=Nitratireductor mangrovi TaxID=2599600 RepID=A0A5B8KZH1_9HYPH|nr:EAL domain-containing protein [Nitratireductor mangrovi]QDZ00991.1 EAL domain-containing protein [Nitratireductor mangrovi]
MLGDIVTADRVVLPLACVLVAAAFAAMLRFYGLYRQSLSERENLAELVENLTEGIYRSSLDGRQLSANRALVKLNGYASEAEQLEGVKDIGKEWYVDPKRREEFREILERDGYVEDFVSEIYRHKTRERIWITESARIVHDKRSGRPLYYEGSVREITETVERLRLEEQFRKLTNHLPGGLFQFSGTCADDMKITYLSEGFENLTGIAVSEHYRRGKMFQMLVLEEDREAYYDAFRQAKKTGHFDHEFRIVAATGTEKWLRMTAKPERSEETIIWHGYVSDISLRKRQALEIEELAYYDPLTRMPNRRLLNDRIAQAVRNCRRGGRSAALFFIDLDNFKTLNDTQGHDIGDEYLVDIAGRLRQCVRETDTVARMGGDEFVVILEDLGDSDAAAASRAIVMANQLLAALRIPFERDEIRHNSSASIGVVVFDGRERRADELLKRADIAMYQAKGAGRDGLALFDPRWMDGETERFTLLGELRRAISDKALELHYQPQIDRTGQVAGAEGLLRWSHPRLGMVPPDRFIPLAEQSGLMNQLCSFVMATGVATLARWRRRPETRTLRLALNVSVQSFAGSGFVPLLAGLIADHGIDASRLTIEFTEHVMAKDKQTVTAHMEALKKLGVRFSLDDFGTGYSSLARLKALPFDEVKIDGSFVQDIEESENDRALVRTILAMANTLGLDAVAEHVETRNQEAFLHAFGCDLFQGYLYRPACREPELLAFVAERNGAASGASEGEVVRLKA